MRILIDDMTILPNIPVSLSAVSVPAGLYMTLHDGKVSHVPCFGPLTTSGSDVCHLQATLRASTPDQGYTIIWVPVKTMWSRASGDQWGK